MRISHPEVLLEVGEFDYCLIIDEACFRFLLSPQRMLDIPRRDFPDSLDLVYLHAKNKAFGGMRGVVRKLEFEIFCTMKLCLGPGNRDARATDG